MEKVKALVGAYLECTGTTKQQLSEKLGITCQSLRSKMDGSTEFTLSQAIKLAHILGCSVDDLVPQSDNNA